jgi:spore maturation protein CgeB
VKVLVIGPGSSYSTADVEAGAIEGLQAHGVEVANYALDRRISASYTYLRQCWRRAKAAYALVEKPTNADVLLHAVQDSLTKALLHRVDWVLLVSAMFVPRPFLAILQRAGLPVATLLTESPYDLDHELSWAEFADLVWTNERTAVRGFRQVQSRSFYLPHAMRPAVHTPFHEDDHRAPAHDVVFVGTAFQERIELLEAIDWAGIDLGLYGQWKNLRRSSPLRQFVRGGVVDNAKTAALYRRAKVGLNLYRESQGWGKDAPRISGAESLNPRAYELAACGCFHLSSARAEVGEMFGDLVPTFRTASECGALIRRWVADDTGRADVSRRLPTAVATHTWTERGRQMASDLRAALPYALERVAHGIASKQQAVRVAA